MDLFKTENHTKALELGCGAGIIFDHLDFDLLACGLDFSETAINFAKRYSDSEFICEDILNFETTRKWDLVLDSHLLHCLIGEEDIKNYLLSVHKLLNFGGVFSIELMVQTKKALFDEGYHYNDRDYCLYKDHIPIRTIFDARKIEELILMEGFKIVYLRVDENIKFIPTTSRSESFTNDPDRMRIICIKE